MAKKSSGVKYTSKGIHSNVSKKNKVKQSAADRIINQYDAYLKGRRAYVTIPNPNKKETNKRFIRVLATEVYGDPRQRGFVVQKGSE